MCSSDLAESCGGTRVRHRGAFGVDAARDGDKLGKFPDLPRSDGRLRYASCSMSVIEPLQAPKAPHRLRSHDDHADAYLSEDDHQVDAGLHHHHGHPGTVTAQVKLLTLAAVVLPPVALSMVMVGEEAGRLPVTFERLSRLYDREVKASVKKALGLLEPAVKIGRAHV